MTASQALDEVRAAMAEIGLGSEEVDPGAHLVDDLDLDSLDWVDLTIQLEEKLDITLHEERFASVRTVQDVADRVCAALASRVRA